MPAAKGLEPFLDTTVSAQAAAQETPSDSGKRITPLPEVFGRYRILKQLGQGGMGTVYLAQDTTLDRRVAVKVPQFTDETNPAVLERFYREARSAATLQHPNICPVYDVAAINGIHFLSMAYIEGTPLSAWVRGASRRADARSPAPTHQLRRFPFPAPPPRCAPSATWSTISRPTSSPSRFSISAAARSNTARHRRTTPRPASSLRGPGRSRPCSLLTRVRFGDPGLCCATPLGSSAEGVPHRSPGSPQPFTRVRLRRPWAVLCDPVGVERRLRSQRAPVAYGLPW